MTELAEKKTTPRAFWIVSIVALLWNLAGVAAYLMQVTMSPEALAALSEAEQALYADIPAWATGAYAIAVFAGTLGSILLLMRKALALPVFVVSLVGILVQMGQALFMTDVLAVRGATAAIGPVAIIVIAVFLVWYSDNAKKKGLLT